MIKVEMVDRRTWLDEVLLSLPPGALITAHVEEEGTPCGTKRSLLSKLRSWSYRSKSSRHASSATTHASERDEHSEG